MLLLDFIAYLIRALKNRLCEILAVRVGTGSYFLLFFSFFLLLPVRLNIDRLTFTTVHQCESPGQELPVAVGGLLHCSPVTLLCGSTTHVTPPSPHLPQVPPVARSQGCKELPEVSKWEP